ncbi:hypothetical protein ES703_23846 [subsurface metagenome]
MMKTGEKIVTVVLFGLIAVGIYFVVKPEPAKLQEEQKQETEEQVQEMKVEITVLEKQQWPMHPILYHGYTVEKIMEIWGTPRAIWVKEGASVNEWRKTIELEYSDGIRVVNFKFRKPSWTDDHIIYPHCQDVEVTGPDTSSFNPWIGGIATESIISYRY